MFSNGLLSLRESTYILHMYIFRFFHYVGVPMVSSYNLADTFPICSDLASNLFNQVLKTEQASTLSTHRLLESTILKR